MEAIMPVNFAKQKVAPKAAPEATKPAAAEAKPTNGKVPWYKRGAAGAAEVDKYEKEMQEKWDEGNKMYRFWMNEGENARVTFIDGNLDAEGHLDSIIFREHGDQEHVQEAAALRHATRWSGRVHVRYRTYR
jgi:hypothetical protein